MVKIEQILLKMQTAQSLRWQDPELAQVFARSALEDAQVTEALRLDPFHPGATMLSANLARRLRAALRSGRRCGAACGRSMTLQSPACTRSSPRVARRRSPVT